MATSSKVLFKLEELQARALESLDSRIAIKNEELVEYDSLEAVGSALQEWREVQEERISTIFRQLASIDNESLSHFKLDPIPHVDRYARSRLVREIRNLEEVRSQVVAKTESLVPDADGNITLTRTQLQDFFDL